MNLSSGKIKDQSNGVLAVDSYHRYKVHSYVYVYKIHNVFVYYSCFENNFAGGCEYNERHRI